MIGSTYIKSTRHPLTGEWDDEARWSTREVSKYEHTHVTEVTFSSGEVFDSKEHSMETRERTIASVELESTPDGKEIEVTEHGTGRRDVHITVNALDVEVNDEATEKAKGVIEKEVFPRITNADVVVTVMYREPIDGKFLYASKLVKMHHVRQYAEACVESFIQQFVPTATASDFAVVEYYKLTDEVKITTLDV